MSKKQAIQELLNRKNLNTNTLLSANTVLQDNSDIVTEKKKATFELDSNLHTDLKVYAAKHNTKMVDVVEAALREYFKKN